MVQNINAYHQDKITKTGSWVLPRPLAVEIDGKWIVWKTQKGLWWLWGGQVLKRFQIFNIFPARKYLRGECTQQGKHLEVGVTSFSRGICCPTAEYEIYIYMNICCLWYISSCFIHLWRRELLSYPRECGLSFWPLGAWFSFRFGVSLGPPRAIILWRSVSQDFYGINQSINQHLGSIGFLGYKSIIIIESPRV